MTTKIEWCQETWNPITGCTKISEGCQNCYAERMAKRLHGRYGYSDEDPFQITFHPDRLEQPLKWRKPRKIFVCSMGDLFHADIDEKWLDEIFRIMSVASKHKFLLLTKRPDIMAEEIKKQFSRRLGMSGRTMAELGFYHNLWLGVTVENQEQADKRIPILLSIPATVRFVSIEPMLSPVKLKGAGCQWCFNAGSNPATGEMCPQCGVDWVIVGGESGPGARPIHPDWVRQVRDDCQSAGVPFFFKQWGSNPDKSAFDEPYNMVCARNELPKYGRLLDGRTWNEYPAILNV